MCALKLKFKKHKPKGSDLICTLCHKSGHEAVTCSALTWCHRCGEKGHFPTVCPHHTESNEARYERQREEKKNWDVQMRLSKKRNRTDEDWALAQEASDGSDEDIPCPIPAVDRPFTEDERRRAEARRQWYLERSARKRRREPSVEPVRPPPSPFADDQPPASGGVREKESKRKRRRGTSASDVSEPEKAVSRRDKTKKNKLAPTAAPPPPPPRRTESEDEDESSISEDASDPGRHRASPASKRLREERPEETEEEPAPTAPPPPPPQPQRPESEEEDEAGISAHRKLFQKDTKYQKKVQTQVKFFKCPDWATPAKGGISLEVRRGGKRMEVLQIDRSLYYLFGRLKGVVDFVAEHPSLSRVHFALVHDGKKNEVHIQDLGSKSGTRVDGIRLEPNKMTKLEFGATIHVGDSSRVYILRRKSIWDDEDDEE